jgi:hypothetical protein
VTQSVTGCIPTQSVGTIKKVYVEVASGVASSLDIFYKRDF